LSIPIGSRRIAGYALSIPVGSPRIAVYAPGIPGYAFRIVGYVFRRVFEKVQVMFRL
jgi:hypothetical protein